MTAAFPHDPDFPQLPLATNPARMLEVFRSNLVPVPGRRVEIEDCVPFRFRCRQATSRCVLQYTLRLRERTANQERGRWRRLQQSVTGVVYAREGEAERQWRESRATEPAREIPPEWLAVEPGGVIPGLAVVVGGVPHDRKLRHLRLVMGGDGGEGRLSAALEPWLLADGWEAEEAGRHIEPLRYRTELGAALRYTVAARRRGTARRTTRTC